MNNRDQIMLSANHNSTGSGNYQFSNPFQENLQNSFLIPSIINNNVFNSNCSRNHNTLSNQSYPCDLDSPTLQTNQQFNDAALGSYNDISDVQRNAFSADYFNSNQNQLEHLNFSPPYQANKPNFVGNSFYGPSNKENIQLDKYYPSTPECNISNSINNSNSKRSIGRPGLKSIKEYQNINSNFKSPGNQFVNSNVFTNINNNSSHIPIERNRFILSNHKNILMSAKPTQTFKSKPHKNFVENDRNCLEIFEEKCNYKIEKFRFPLIENKKENVENLLAEYKMRMAILKGFEFLYDSSFEEETIYIANA